MSLLAPRFYAARNAVRRTPVRHLILGTLVALFWGFCFALFVRVLNYFQTIGDFGPLLTQRLLVLLCVSFFMILLISNTVTALTTYYLAEDVPLLLAAPVPFHRLHRARFVETVVTSSWMVLLFGLPAFLAYGVVYRAGAAFYAGTVVVLVPFLVIPAAIGVIVTTILVLVFPARGTRDALLLLSGLLIAAAALGIRALQPERLANPMGLAGFAGFLARFGATGSPWLPTTWAAEVLIPLLGVRSGDPLFYLGMLASTATMLFLVSGSALERVFLTAWSRAQTGRVRAAGSERALSRWLAAVARPLPRLPGLLLAKDATIFLRDAGQWSQLLLLLALVGVYVYNFSALPLNDGSPIALAMRNLAAVFNLALGAFVTTSVAVRFVYPMASLEGRAWWILRTAPVPLRSLWWGKFWLAFVPLATFGEALVATTNHLLDVPPSLTILFLIALLPLTAAIVSLGLAFGAAHPKLDVRNAAQVATGFGAIVYMVTCLVLIAIVVGLEAWPVARLYWHRGSLPPGPVEWTGIGLAFAAAIALPGTAFVVAHRAGLRYLAHLGD